MTQNEDSTPNVSGDHPSTPPAQRSPWPGWLRFAFRFAFVFYSLALSVYAIFLIQSYVPRFLLDLGIEDLALKYGDGADGLVTWVTRQLFDSARTEEGSLMGDVRGDVAYLLICASVAAVGAIFWTLIHRHAKYDRRLFDWLLIGLRLVLGLELISYGCTKIIPMQMPPPSLTTLSYEVGEIPPSGLVWIFMGSSPAYQVFAGIVEFVAGWFLVARRTTTLGALLAMAALMNVMAINYCYDVPVKLYSTLMFSQALILVLPDRHRLFRFFISHQELEANQPRGPFASRWANRSACFLVIGFFAYATWVDLSSRLEGFRTDLPESALHGVWLVESFQKDGQPVASADADGWLRVIVESSDYWLLTIGGLESQWVSSEISESEHTITLTHSDPEWTGTFTYAQNTPEDLSLNGVIGEASVQIQMRRRPDREWPVNQGLQWLDHFRSASEPFEEKD